MNNVFSNQSSSPDRSGSFPLAIRRTISIALLAVLTAGCVRTGSSPNLLPPEDPQGAERLQQVESLLSDPELMLGESSDYTLGPGDVFTVTILGRPDILGSAAGEPKEGTREGMTFTVTENPMIVFPLIGAVKVHGKTVEQLQKELTDAYNRFVREPWVIVTIDKYYRNQVSVLGAVNTPGRYPWEFGDTVLDSLFKAGGLAFTTRGGLPPGRFLRVYREKVSQKERQELSLEELIKRLSEGKRILSRTEITIPIEDFVLNGNLSYNIPVRPGDILYVPTAGAVMVQGHVQYPGVTYLGPSLHTLTQVITERGGLRYGARSVVEVVRSLHDGDQANYFLNVRAMQDREERDFLLQDGDQVFVFRHPVRYPLEWIGNIFRASVATGVSATYSPAK